MSSEDTTLEGTVQNAHVRYKKHIDSLGTKAHAYRRVKKNKQRNKPSLGFRQTYTTETNHKKIVENEIIDSLNNEGLEHFIQEIRNKSATKAPLPPFPFVMLTIAIMKDIIDVPGELSVIGIVLTTALSLVIALVLFFWFMGKVSGKWWKGRMVSWLWKRYVFAIALEFIPFFKIVPATTILVLMAHFRETKTVKILNSAMEAIHSAKFKFKLD